MSNLYAEKLNIVSNKTTIMLLRSANLGHTTSSEASLKQFLPAGVKAYSLAMKSFHHA